MAATTPLGRAPPSRSSTCATLPQILAKLYVNAGLIRPAPVFKGGLLYGLVLSLPFAIFSFSFALSAVTHSRRLVFTSWFWSGIIALALLQFGFWYEDLVWDNLNGFFSFPLLLASGIAALCLGRRAYQRKEIGHYGAPITIPPRFWFWLAVFLAGI